MNPYKLATDVELDPFDAAFREVGRMARVGLLMLVCVAVLGVTIVAQAPAAKVSTPPVAAVTAKAEPLPELVRLRVELLQAKADILGRQLRESDVYRAYEDAMKKLGVEMDSLIDAQKAACFTLNQVDRTRTPIVPCKDGK